MPATALSNLVFDHRFIRKLPGDPVQENYRRQVRNCCYSRVSPTPVSAPTIIGWSAEMAATLGLAPEAEAHNETVQILSGSAVPECLAPFAMRYGGHQFGNWAGQLGDGRAIILGETISPQSGRWVLQLKGAGPTPYSRTADGLAVLRSSVREFLCSEAMFHLGVPTTRALSLVTTGESVLRDMFYDGNPEMEPGAVVCRVSPSFTRFGNFQIHATMQEYDLLASLVDYTITTDFPELGPPSPEVREEWFRQVCIRTADLMTHWMRTGFVHGVMNTDNMSILGLTIDYGPYGWLEDFDTNWTPNTTDASGRRYCYGRQPSIALWNLLQLANSLTSLFDDSKPLQNGLDEYTRHFNQQCLKMMKSKIGLQESESERSQQLAEALPELLQSASADMTLFYRKLADLSLVPDKSETSLPPCNDSTLDQFAEVLYDPKNLNSDTQSQILAWIRDYQAELQRCGVIDSSRKLSMNAVNPRFVLRNYLAQMAIDCAEQGDPSLIAKLLDVLRHPYEDQPENEQYGQKRPEWARDKAGCSMLSCSS
jgi:uncharacterized protein YdiU (UPF0061 family)